MFGRFRKTHFSDQSLLRIFVSALCVVTFCQDASAEGWTADTREMYGHVYLHPKQFAGSVSELGGWTDVRYVDGTYERWVTREFEEKNRVDQQALDAYRMNPSTETFKSLNSVQKYEVGAKSFLIIGRDIPDEVRKTFKDGEQNEAYIKSFQGPAVNFLSTLPKAEQDRVAQGVLEMAITAAGQGSLSASRTVGLFASVTKNDPEKMRQIICARLYTPVPARLQRSVLNQNSDFNEFGETAYEMEVLLGNLPQADQLLSQSCPLKEGLGSFKIGEQVAKLKLKFSKRENEEETNVERQTNPIQIRVLSTVKCSNLDFLAELKDVELDFIRTPSPHTNWFRRNVGECRFQGSVKKVAKGKFEFQLQAALPGETKVSAVPFKDFDELKLKLKLIDDKSQNRSSVKTAEGSAWVKPLGEARSVRIGR